jgi:hypothetical protein
MSAALQARAEVLKLARLLGRDPSSLGYLEAVPVADLAALREQVTDRLFDANGKALARLAGASRVLPTGVLATLGERAFGPFLCARFAGLLDPARAVDVASKLSPEFLADVAVELDPRRATDVIGRIPAAQVASVTRELAAREEYVALGRFVGHIDDEALRAALGEMDDRVLLQTAFVLEGDGGLDELADVIGSERLVGVVRAGEESELWAEGLELLAGLRPAQRAAIVALLTDDERARLDARAVTAGILDLIAETSTMG